MEDKRGDKDFKEWEEGDEAVFLDPGPAHPEDRAGGARVHAADRLLHRQADHGHRPPPQRARQQTGEVHGALLVANIGRHKYIFSWLNI